MIYQQQTGLLGTLIDWTLPLNFLFDTFEPKIWYECNLRVANCQLCNSVRLAYVDCHYNTVLTVLLLPCAQI
jgi:hypothetical protein